MKGGVINSKSFRKGKLLVFINSAPYSKEFSVSVISYNRILTEVLLEL